MNLNWRNRLVTGLGIGSFVYLVMVLFHITENVTARSVINVFLISAFVGFSNYIFDTGRWSYLVCFLLHYLMVSAFVSLLFSLEGITYTFLNILGSVFIVYVLSYVVVMIRARLVVRDLNRQIRILHERKK